MNGEENGQKDLPAAQSIKGAFSKYENTNGQYMHIQRCAGSVTDHNSKASKQAKKLFGFPLHIKVMFILHHSLLSMQYHCV